MLKTALAALVLAASLPATALAETTGQIGPVIGQAAPSLEGTVTVTPDNAVLAAGTSGTVLVFVRSADWCPFCKNQLVDLKSAAQPLSDTGWALKALSYDSVQTLEDFAAETELNFALLSDEDSSEIDAFGLRNTEVREGSRADGIPHPAVVFIASDGTVAAVLREESYRDRPQVDAVLETATRLSAADEA